ncbi:hypothetical protein H5410_064794 [Solanum commersonii]|uniref:Cytochrome P450 71A4 n=1 Tax=Solanum commersonii TaxID=4109 RepID=A0A9J5VYP9_SOLCO|nr:hypothetical protein H5410_064794 [Solanum commersonii]
MRVVLSCMTNNIISRVTIGRTYNEGESGIAVKGLLQELLALIGTFNIGEYIPWLIWLNKINGLDSRVKKVAKDLDAFLESVIEERVIRNNKGEYSPGDAKDFVDVLLEIQNGKETGFPLQRDSLKAILLTTLEWIMIELLRNPRAMEKLQNEVRGLVQGKAEITEDDLGNMQYLKAVIKETLRLHPPIPLLIPRESTEDIELLGYHIPAKTQVIINAWAIGRDPLSWDDPEEYRPERFLNSNINIKGLNFELIPFGAGRRGCPGTVFAIVVIEVALARLVHKFNFSLPKPEELDMTEASGIAIRRKSPLLALATPYSSNLHQLGSLPHRSLHQLSKKYGPVMLLHFGSKPVIVASSVDAARDIMKTHDLVCSNRPKSSIAERLFYGSKDVAFSPYGEYWRQIKSVTVLHLLSNKRVQSYRDIREEETSNMIVKIRQECDSNFSSSVIDLRDCLCSLTNNIVSRVALGRKYNEEGQGGMNAKVTLHEFGELLGTFSIGDYIPWLECINKINGLDNKVEKVAKELDTFLESVIEEHVSRKNRGEYSMGEAKDFVDVLLEIQNGKETGFLLQRDSLKAIILDIFAAGTDTTYTALEWIMTELLRHPRAMEKLQNEVRGLAQGKAEVTEDDLGNMQYLKAVIKETFRLHPPDPLLVPRESTEDIKLLGYHIPAKTQVIIDAWTIGRDPLSWENPEDYLPERFLDSNIDLKGLNFELIPFGAGRRGCPGIAFAIVVIELALARLVHKFNFSLPEELDMTEASGVTIRRKSPLLAVATPCSTYY